MLVEGVERFSFNGADCELSGVQTGNPEGRDLVLIHGMRDHALSLMPVAREFAGDFRVTLPDLRGHGDSANSGSYSMMQFVADLRALIEQKQLLRPIIMGHSLGGHIASRYTALYDEEVTALVLMDGMGPPVDRKKASWRDASREQIQTLLQLRSQRNTMPDAQSALARLQRNNPRLHPDVARMIVDTGIEPHPDGGVQWKWDPAVGMVWSTFSHDESEQQWASIESPVLIVTGDEALDYWSRMRPALKGKEALHLSEIERRRQRFRSAESRMIKGAGHMIHYDQPRLLNQVLRGFVDKVVAASSPD
ncbi:MAG: alpha/beta hydrolase [Gammaproteobacteria bacterium]|nr:alpha/beta hydrolase [Gammaproteobacteria bacterium]